MLVLPDDGNGPISQCMAEVKKNMYFIIYHIRLVSFLATLGLYKLARRVRGIVAAAEPEVKVRKRLRQFHVEAIIKYTVYLLATECPTLR